MPELIDREASLKLCSDTHNPYHRIVREFLLTAPTVDAEPVQKPEMSEADRKKCEEWCKDCEHIEMCKWYPFGGCDFRLLPKPEQPTVEAEPVRHGRWEIINKDANVWKCTTCGEEWMLNDGNPSDNNMLFCPHCGSRMFGGYDND